MADNFFKEIEKGLYKGELNPPVGALRKMIEERKAAVVVGHPTFKNEDNIPIQLGKTIAGAAQHFGDKGACVVVVDGTYTESSKDQSTIDAALDGAKQALAKLSDEEREKVFVVVTPYEGYGEDKTPGKGSALKMIFEEGAKTSASMFVLLDGDLRNDMAQWQGVFKKVEDLHRANLPECDFFITARYARHFVDASLTRFIVGPLTTLLGSYVPGGISGDIVLSGGAVEHELGDWSEARRKYGTDISTTFDNIADSNTAIYEVYLGAKLHDITDEGKLSVMPGEVIGAALESLLRHRERFEEVLNSDRPVEEPCRLGPDFTGIEFIDPGRTDVFKIETKMKTLVDKWPTFSDDVKKVLGEEKHAALAKEVSALEELAKSGTGELVLLNMNRERWIDCLVQAVGRTLATGDVDVSKRALNYLYTAAFLEFCRERLIDLGYKTVEAVKEAQGNLGVDADKAESFYEERVDGEAIGLAYDFYDARKKILEAAKRFK